MAAPSLITMADDLDIISFSTVEELWSWLEDHHATHPGVWVRLQNARSAVASIGFHDLLEAGIAYGWSESTRRAYDSTAYLQKFTPDAPEALPRSATWLSLTALPRSGG